MLLAMILLVDIYDLISGLFCRYIIYMYKGSVFFVDIYIYKYMSVFYTLTPLLIAKFDFNILLATLKKNCMMYNMIVLICYKAKLINLSHVTFAFNNLF